MKKELLPVENLIYEIRQQRVMLDSDLAKLYGVETGRLNEAVKRNISRFPENFMFQLTPEEYETLISQFAISKKRGGRRFMPYVFTEQGVAMLSSVLRSEQAIQVNIKIMNTFVALRKYAMQSSLKNKEIEDLRKILMLHIENTENKFNQNEKTVKSIINVLNNLIEKPRETKRIGFDV